ncbi:MAG: Unknown protein [uncultured Sulfurovum sp.]|uniref:OmpA-like domain-containing protein n=1 Tax=uncultured Sulfurovum sp. TaxID=269237 RepID=A0A6S6TY75_9BACT|nr:MAG: Unknown protein [uncultured Sulfurovum sp.]
MRQGQKQSSATMQSEIFIVLMIVMVLLFIITSFYISKLKEHQQPPLIVLDEAHGYSFGLGSATLNENFQVSLNSSVISKIEQFAKKYKCDIVEVYGYTDGKPFGGGHTIKQSFDKSLHNCLVKGCDMNAVEASSNLELGMKRAVSVVNFLTPKLVNKNSSIKIIRPYSAGGFVDDTGRIASIDEVSNNKLRRRIEIRLSRMKDLKEGKM